MSNMWMVRSQAGELIPLFTENGIVALGWGSLGKLSELSKQEIKNKLSEIYSGKTRSISVWASIIENFIKTIKTGDYVLTYDATAREYYIGKIKSDYFYDSNIDSEYSNLRKVDWNTLKISRDNLSAKSRYSLGSLATIFKVSADAEKEILAIISNTKTTITDDDQIKEEVEIQSKELFENSTENLKDRIASLSPDDMEELLKEILNAMGYIAIRTPKGADRGIDIFASKDGLGLEEPRIFAEVKHRSGKIDAQGMRTFLGGRQTGDKCIFLSTGGFTKDAKYEAERSKIPLSLIDLDSLAELITLHYDKFRSEGKLLLPLKKIYIPA